LLCDDPFSVRPPFLPSSCERPSRSLRLLRSLPHRL